jgi:iron complex outermembrane receptor protein
MIKTVFRLTCISLSLLAWTGSSQAAHADPAAQDVGHYVDLSIEDLLNQEVTSANKRAQRLSDVAAAAFVITADDIRESGARSLPEALRLAPGVDVARISADRWAVSIRGFSGFFANKLLVLVDGRSAFTPSFNGVIWNGLQFPLENIERIEVIRGPGGSVWGVNAVNGVVNIITKSARQLQGNQVVIGAGDETGPFVQARHGGALGADSNYSVYVREQRGNASSRLSGEAADDAYHHQSAGFRLDGEDGTDSWALSGNAYRTRSDVLSILPDPLSPQTGYWRSQHATDDISGHDLLAHVTRRLSSTSSLELTLSWTHGIVDLRPAIARLEQDIVNAEVQHTLRLGNRHNLTWGLAYHHYTDRASQGDIANLDPERESLRTTSIFGQDEFKLTDTLRLTAGARLDHQKYTGSEFQPSLSMLWKADPNRSLWTSIARASRIPSRGEVTGEVAAAVIPPPTFGPMPALTVVDGRRGLDAERMDAFEIGYRGQETARLFIDATAYVHRYRDLITPSAPDVGNITMGSGYLVVPLRFANAGAGTMRGIEMSADWRVMRQWHVRGSYSYAEFDGRSINIGLVQPPRHIFSVLSSWAVNHRTDLSLWLRHVAKREGLDGQDIAAYDSADLRLAWRPSQGVELSLVGQNLLDDGHQEFTSSLPAVDPTRVERGVYGQITIDF